MKTVGLQLSQVDEYQNVILFLKNISLIKNKSEIEQKHIEILVNKTYESISTDRIANW